MTKPFKVEITEENLQNIYSKVKNYQWHEMPDDGGLDYGTNLEYMKEFSKFWIEKISRNKKRDLLNEKKIKSLGYKHFVIWECDIRKPEVLLKEVKKIKKHVVALRKPSLRQ